MSSRTIKTKPSPAASTHAARTRDQAAAIVRRYAWHVAPLAPDDVIDPAEPFEAWATELPGHRVSASDPAAALDLAMTSAIDLYAGILARDGRIPEPLADQSRVVQVNLKLTAAEAARLDDAARRAGTNRSNFVRAKALDKSVDRPPALSPTARTSASRGVGPRPGKKRAALKS